MIKRVFLTTMLAAMASSASAEPRAEEVLTAEAAWSDKQQTELCLNGVGYRYIHHGEMGGLTPMIADDGRMVRCEEGAWPEVGDYHKVCDGGILHYQLQNDHGLALSVALQSDGRPMSCEQGE